MASGSRITTTGVLYINGQQVENTFQNISRITRNLERDLRRLPPGTREFIDTAQNLRRARERLAEVRNEINSVSGALQQSSGFMGIFRNGLLRFGETFREVFSANLAERFFDTIISKGKETVDQLLDIADAMTDVQKTSGMTLEQVKDMWDEFDKMDTRTSKLDRLKIAEVGGRLGVPTEEMKDFVKEVDKAYVALGDSFEGGLEGVVDQLGKIKGLFEGTKELKYAEAINRIGSALNTLAAQGTASEGNISQFALRVGNLPEALRPSIDKVLGLGAAFEESGIDAQIAASGFSNFISAAGEGIDAFAISMHMSTEEAKNLLNTKPEEFFLRFAAGMKGLNATDTAAVFSSLKLNSLEVQKAVGAAANRTEEFKKAMQTAGIEMDKMTSLTDEFNQKNNNAPAILEKIKNAFNDMFTSTNIINKFEGLIQAVGWLTGVTDESGNGMIIFKERLSFLYKMIIVLISGVIGYNAAMLILILTTKNAARETLIYNIVQKAKVAWEAISRAATLLSAAAYALLTGNIARATVAMRAFNIATKANLIGILIGVITAVIVAIQLFSKEVDEAVAKQKMLNEVNKEAEKGIISQKRELEQLVKTAKDENLSKEIRAQAIQKLNKLSPEYLGNLTLENIKTQEATNAIKAYTDALLRNSKIKVLNKKLDEINEKIIDEQDKPIKDVTKDHGNWVDRNLSFLTPSEVKFMDKDQRKQFDLWKKKGGDDYARQMMDAYGYIYEKRNQAIQKLNNDAATLSEQIANLSTLPSVEENTVPKNIAIPGKPKKEKKPAGANKDFFSDIKSARDAELKADEDFLKAKQLLSEERIKIIEDEFQKESQEEITRRNIELQNSEAERKKIENEIKALKEQKEKLNKDFNAKEKPTAKDKDQISDANNSIDAAISKKQKMFEKGEVLDQIAEKQEETHQFNLRKIQETTDQKIFEKFIEYEQRKIDEQRRQDEEEILKLASVTEAKKRLKNSEYLVLTETELSNIKTLEDAKTALREEADRKMLAAQLKSLNQQKKILEQQLEGMTGPAAEKLKADLDTLNQKITQVKSAIKSGTDSDNKKVIEESGTEKGKVDILGFSAKDWEDTWGRLDTTAGKIEAVKMIVQSLGNVFQAFSQLQQTLADKEMRKFEKNNDKKKKELLKQLNEGYINQEEYQKGVQLLEVQTENKKAEIAYKQAKMQRTVQMASAIANTALGVIGALSMQPWTWANIAAAALVGVMGGVQIATIANQPLPEKPSFDGGGFTGSGFGSPDSSGFKAAGIVHENEWVAPKWMLEEPRTAKVIDYLESVRTGRSNPMATGGFSSDNTTASVTSNAGPTESNDTLIQYTVVMSDVKNLLQKLYDEGVIAKWTDDAETGKRMNSAINNFKTIETRAKRK